MKEDTTGREHYGFELTPPFPLVDLVELISAELQPSDEERSTVVALLQRKLPPLIRGGVLSLILGISPKLIHAMAHAPEKYYRQFKLPKRGGGIRFIDSPRVFLKVVQRWILQNILYNQKLPNFVTGFVPAKGILENARIHVGHSYLFRLDIKDFFPSVKRAQVQVVYSRFGFPDEVSALLARLSTLRGVLPQGAPTSPYLANLVFLPCDKQISEIAESDGLFYSRYADDLTLSSNHPIAEAAKVQIQQAVVKGGFTVNPRKLKSAGPGQRLMTTGIVVNAKVHPMRTLRRNLRARFHQARLHPRRFIKQANQLLGWAAYVNSYDAIRGQEYLKIANDIAALSKRSKA